MKKTVKKLLAVLMAATMSIGLVSFNASAATATQLVNQIKAVGLNADETSPGVVTVTGATTATSPLILDIDQGVTVDWAAFYSGSLDRARYVLTLSGAGTFNLTGSIENLAGGAVNVTSAGAELNIDGGTLYSLSPSGMTINIAENNIAVNVTSNGAVTNGGASSAINVTSGRTGVQINIDGGAVTSVPNGNAINDSGANTKITVQNGAVVTAGITSAIRSTGTDSSVTITGGSVTNAATSNAGPTIYMNGTSKDVTISGATVQNTVQSTTAYAIQTTGRVVVEDDAFVTAYGRAINLVGANSSAVVNGGTVRATGAGATSYAISTATTAGVDVTNTSIEVMAGTVSSDNGDALHITGANSKIVVSGGSVLSVSGNAINATSSAANSSVIISGGSVSAETGCAIQNDGVNSTVTVSDTPNGMGGAGGRGGQVSVRKAGAAINAKGTVTVNGGFVFAYATATPNASTAISAPVVNGPYHYSRGMVGVWIQSAGRVVYSQAATLDLSFSVGGNNAMQWYYSHLLGESGIYYNNALTAGFFPLTQVTVTYDYGLVFDSNSGRMYKDSDGTGSLSALNLSTPFIIGQGTAWTGIPGELRLNGFSWSTTAKTALTIVGRETTIILNGNSTFESTSNSGVSCGIRSAEYDLTIDGDGILTAVGRDNVGANVGANLGIDLDLREMTILGGTFIAKGGQAVGFGNRGDDDIGLSMKSTYFRWEWRKDYDQRGPVQGPFMDWDTGYNEYDEFKFFNTDKYVLFQTLEPVSFTAQQRGGVSGRADSTGIILNFSKPVAGLTADDVMISGDAVKDPVLTGAGETWTIALGGVSREGTVSVQLNHFGNFFAVPDIADNVEVYKANRYALDIADSAGGAISGAVSGQYLEETLLNVSASPDAGFHFKNWTVNGLTGVELDNPTISFSMPGNDVELEAEFEQDAPPIEPEPGGLIFDADTGNMYFDADGSGTLTPADTEYTDGRGVTWDGEIGKLTLSGFVYETDAPTALTIAGNTSSTAIVYLAGNGSLTSLHSDVAHSRGIKIADDLDIVIAGSGTLSAQGGYGFDLGTGSLSITGGTLIAQGSQRAIAWIGGETGPNDSYYGWEFSEDYDGDNATTGFGWDEPFIFYPSDHYVMLHALIPLSFTAEQTGGEPGTADSTGIRLTFDVPNVDLTASVTSLNATEIVSVYNDSGEVVCGALTGAGNVWNIALDSVGAEGTVFVELAHFGDFFVDPNVRGVEVYKAGQRQPVSPAPVEPVIPGEGDNQANSGGGNSGIANGGDVSAMLDTKDHIAYVQGVGDGMFEPERDMTRAEVAQMFYNLLVDKATGTAVRFPDVPGAAWYSGAVQTLTSLGILTGYPDGGFHPDAGITRAEFVAIASRFAKDMPGVVNNLPFNDVPGAHWAYAYINAAVQFGWVTGYEDMSFQPGRLISRAEVVTIVNRMLDRAADRAYIDSHTDIARYSDVPESYWAFYDIMEASHAHDYLRQNGAEVWE